VLRAVSEAKFHCVFCTRPSNFTTVSLIRITEKAAMNLSEPKMCSYVVYMWQYDSQITAFFVHLISGETNLKAESSCWV
jgi:hypothetical protein